MNTLHVLTRAVVSDGRIRAPVRIARGSGALQPDFKAILKRSLGL